MSESSEETRSQGGDSNPTVDVTTVAPINPGYAGGFCQTPTSRKQPGTTPDRAGLHNESTLMNWPISGNSSHHEEFLQKPWRSKTMTCCLQNGLAGVHKGIEIHYRTYRGHNQLLAELYRRGYQYRSLNSYRSAISAMHERVMGT